MAKGSGLTQHKTRRDTASPLKENRALKQENRSLKRQLSKLRKQMGKMVDSHMASQQQAAEEIASLAKPDAAYEAGGCVGCGGFGNTVSFQIPGSQTTLTVCKTCGNKERTKK